MLTVQSPKRAVDFVSSGMVAETAASNSMAAGRMQLSVTDDIRITLDECVIRRPLQVQVYDWQDMANLLRA